MAFGAASTQGITHGAMELRTIQFTLNFRQEYFDSLGWDLYRYNLDIQYLHPVRRYLLLHSMFQSLLQVFSCNFHF